MTATCKRGHPRTPENTYQHKGRPACKVCNRDGQRMRNHARGAKPRSSSLFCSRGHRKTAETVRPGRSDCAICHRESQARRYHADPERHRGAASDYQRANRAKASARQADWRAKNREHVRDYFRAQTRLRRVGKDREAADYVETAVIRDPCSYCGAPGGTIDHIVPVTRGGDSRWDNLAAACAQCNAQKRNKSLLRFLVDRRHRRPPRRGTPQPRSPEGLCRRRSRRRSGRLPRAA